MSPQLLKQNFAQGWFKVTTTGLLTIISASGVWAAKEVYAIGQRDQLFLQVKDKGEKTESKVEGLKDVVGGLLVIEGRQDAEIQAMKEQVARLMETYRR